MSLLPLILGLLAAFAPLAIDMYLPALPEMAMALGSDSSGAQLTIASYFVGMGLGQLIYGPLTDRFGRRPPLFVGVGLFLLASLACALAQTLPQMVALRFVQALGGCAGMVVARAVVRDVAHLRDPVRLMGRLMLIMGVAPILAPFMGGLLSAWLGWRAIFIFLALFAAAALLLVALLLPETHAPERRLRQRPRAILAAYAALLADGRFLLRPGLASGCAIAGMFAYIAGSPAVFMEVHGIAPGQYGIWFGINAAGIIAGSQASGWLAERWGREVVFTRMLRAMAVAALGLVIATWLGQGFAVIFLCLFAYIAMLGVVLPLGTVLGMAHFAALAGTASALLGTLQFGLGGLAGAVLGSVA
ncbi:Bcr/CflA family efflux MFS transporter [Rhodovarius sp.]|uniref:Bcr/CflA family efflux MFS transporter n=1 Tax=Rhodovarius sp. TaxID=2972673 RepID=UPI003341E1FF